MVFCGLYPVDSTVYELLRDALEKLILNDSSFTYEPESSLALGFGFRCGFLGLLHMEIIQERLEREYGIELITTAPTVVSKVTDTKGVVHFSESPQSLPPPQEIVKIEELDWVELTPRDIESQYDSIRLGFDKDILGMMVMFDNLGQVTRVDFTQQVINKKQDDDTFNFEPPQGIDIIDDRG